MDFDLVRLLVEPSNDYAFLKSALINAQAKAAAYLGLPNAVPPLDNGCAATLSALLRGAGIEVKMEGGAGDLASHLEHDRRWPRVAVGLQQSGDIGVTFDNEPPHGADHLYLVIHSFDSTTMLIADNQQSEPHQRMTVGDGTTRTSYFLRAKPGRAQVDKLEVAVTSAPLLHNSQITTIISVIDHSEFRSSNWGVSGHAPLSYLRGMAVAFANVYSRLKTDPTDQTVALMAAAVNPADIATDALAWYSDQFKQAGLNLDDQPETLLRLLFVFLTGLGMRETTGRYCMGRYMHQVNVASETAEAGLFQSSYNLIQNHVRYQPITDRYVGSTSMLEIFSSGIKCADSEAVNWGTGAAGLAFQQLSKQCPAYAVEIAALGVRTSRSHWGPINERTVELYPEWNTLLQVVQWIVDHP